MDPEASDVTNLNVMVQQQVFDREHMAVLKAAIEKLHETNETQRIVIETADKKFEEQAAVNLRMMKEHAELRGICTQHAVRNDTKLNGVMDSIKGQDMVDLVESVAADMIEVKIETAFKALSVDIDQMKKIITVHETREQGMAAYLDNLMGERPAEGAVIMTSFDRVDTQILNITSEMYATHAEVAEQIAFLKSSLMQVGAQPVGMAAADQSTIESLKLQFTTLAVAVDELKGARNVESLATRVGMVENAVRAAVAANPLGGQRPAAVGPYGVCGGGFPTGGGCGGCGGTPTSVPSGPAGAPTAFAVASGGHGICHCHHVTELIGTVAGHGARITALELVRGRAPLIGSAGRAQPDAHPGGAPTPHMTGPVESPDTYMWSLDGPLQ